MKNSYDQQYTLETLIKIIYLIDSVDFYTKGHSERVAKYAQLLGKELKLNEKDLETLELGAMLHDIGKISIPNYLLIKNSHLSNHEFEVMKKHVTIGEALLPDEGYKEVKMIIRSHHERLDGKGYPDGLKGTEIPYFARIISVVDTFDAITSQRAYNKVKTLEEAFKELSRASKKQLINDNEIVQQLDPYIVKYFIQAVRNNQKLMEEFQNKDLEILNNRNKYKYKK